MSGKEQGLCNVLYLQWVLSPGEEPQAETCLFQSALPAMKMIANVWKMFCVTELLFTAALNQSYLPGDTEAKTQSKFKLVWKKEIILFITKVAIQTT